MPGRIRRFLLQCWNRSSDSDSDDSTTGDDFTDSDFDDQVDEFETFKLAKNPSELVDPKLQSRRFIRISLVEAPGVNLKLNQTQTLCDESDQNPLIKFPQSESETPHTEIRKLEEMFDEIDTACTSMEDVVDTLKTGTLSLIEDNGLMKLKLLQQRGRSKSRKAQLTSRVLVDGINEMRSQLEFMTSENYLLRAENEELKLQIEEAKKKQIEGECSEIVTTTNNFLNQNFETSPDNLEVETRMKKMETNSHVSRSAEVRRSKSATELCGIECS